MKIILSSPILGEIARLRDMLENAGIICFTRNEISSGLSPEIPLSESTPELWIQDDKHLAEALEIKRAWKTSPPVGGSCWLCSTCGETSEPQFSSCWKCGTERNDDCKTLMCPDDKLDSSELTTSQPHEKEIIEEVDDGIPCVSCGKSIKIGVKYCPFCSYTQPYEPLA
jgi:hypothetical protein